MVEKVYRLCVSWVNNIVTKGYSGMVNNTLHPLPPQQSNIIQWILFLLKEKLIIVLSLKENNKTIGSNLLRARKLPQAQTITVGISSRCGGGILRNITFWSVYTL